MLHKVYDFIDTHLSELWGGVFGGLTYSAASGLEIGNNLVNRHVSQIETEAIHSCFAVASVVFGYVAVHFLKKKLEK